MSPGKSNTTEGPRISKNSLVREIGRRTGIRQRDVRSVINTMIEIIDETCVQAGGRVVLYGFGTFERRYRAGRGYKHPVAGYRGRSAPSTYLHFSQSRALVFD